MFVEHIQKNNIYIFRIQAQKITVKYKSNISNHGVSKKYIYKTNRV